VTTSTGTIVVYEGRLNIGLPGIDGLRVFDEWSLVPQRLGELDRARQVIILDPMSFPLESVSEKGWEAPLAVAVPEDLGLDDLAWAFGGALFDRLTYHDLLIVGDDPLWHALARRHGFAAPQRLVFGPDEMGDAVAWLVESGERMPKVGEAVAPLRRDRETKAEFVRQAGTVLPSLAELEVRTPEGMQPHALVVGCGGGVWLRALLARGFAVVGFDRRELLIEEAGMNYPELEVKHLGAHLHLGVGSERFDLALCIGALGNLQPVEQIRLIRQMWQAIRPGGMLVVLERFVPGNDAGWMPVPRLMEVVSEASSDHIVLEDVQTCRFGGRSDHSLGAVTFVKIGPPESPR